mmetsp:Transcript_22854/g.57799  ORF Transcript_22854/g.57799 Transcript_22854/m.57799 type:complete len:258 (+) Transcript_22854:836-1609(+)
MLLVLVEIVASASATCGARVVILLPAPPAAPVAVVLRRRRLGMVVGRAAGPAVVLLRNAVMRVLVLLGLSIHTRLQQQGAGLRRVLQRLLQLAADSVGIVALLRYLHLHAGLYLQTGLHLHHIHASRWHLVAARVGRSGSRKVHLRLHRSSVPALRDWHARSVHHRLRTSACGHVRVVHLVRPQRSWIHPWRSSRMVHVHAARVWSAWMLLSTARRSIHHCSRQLRSLVQVRQLLRIQRTHFLLKPAARLPQRLLAL